MGEITSRRLRELIASRSVNSSHPVLALGGFSAFETSDGWVFAYVRRGSVALAALEPLTEEAEPRVPAGKLSPLAFASAWRELRQHLGVERVLFVGIGRGFASLLEDRAFQVAQVGKEPWVDLTARFGTGRKTRGMRAARNQAIRGGLAVEEWSAGQLAADPLRRETLLRIEAEWRSRRALQLNGFLHATDPLADLPGRRWFVARRGDRVEGYLIATPIGATGACFLEDLVYARDASRGLSELLTWAALEALQLAGFEKASLGVVSTLQPAEGAGGAWGALAAASRLFYNSQGLELFRKRFKPARWDPVYLALGRADGAPARARDWLAALLALLRAFEPRLELRWGAIGDRVLRLAGRYRVTLGYQALVVALFALINRGGDLPAWALARLGFLPSAPPSQWAYRSLVSDLLRETRLEFWVTLAWMTVLLAWTERTQRRGTLLRTLLAVSLLDDFASCLLFVQPAQWIHGEGARRLLHESQVGGGFIGMALLGMQVWKLKSARDLVIPALVIAGVLGAAAASRHWTDLLLNLNLLVMLAIGLLAGKLARMDEANRSRQVCRAPAPRSQVSAPPPATT